MNYSQLPFHSSSRENCKHPFNDDDILNSSYFDVYIYLYFLLFNLIPLNVLPKNEFIY